MGTAFGSSATAHAAEHDGADFLLALTAGHFPYPWRGLGAMAAVLLALIARKD